MIGARNRQRPPDREPGLARSADDDVKNRRPRPSNVMASLPPMTGVARLCLLPFRARRVLFDKGRMRTGRSAEEAFTTPLALPRPLPRSTLPC